MALKTETRTLPPISVVRCKGPLVFGEETTEFHVYIKELLPKTPNIILNLEGVRYLDSSGMGMLIGIYTSARKAGGAIKLVGLTKKVRSVLERSKLLALFEVYGSDAEALASFNDGN